MYLCRKIIININKTKEIKTIKPKTMNDAVI